LMANENKGTLGFMDLMSIAVGQIIGAGVMVMSISALGMTGRSVNIAFMIAAVFTLFTMIPTVFVASVARFHGGIYSQYAVFIHPIFAGFQQYTTLLSSVGLGMFGLGLASYIGMLIPAIGQNQKMWAIIFMLIFFALNWFGTAWMAKVQGFMFYFLVAALVLFTVMGLPKANIGSYFGNELFGQPLFANGMSGLIEAASYLTYATGGAQVILAFSGEAKKPTTDIPKVIIIATLSVAFLYALLATVIGGVLPADQVIAIGNLAPIADLIMPKPLYYFFVIGGAGFALGTTLNSSIASSFPPMLRAARDGWFPGAFGKVNKHGVPYVWMFLRMILNIAVVASGFDTGVLGKWTLVIGNVINLVVVASVGRIDKLFPEQWEKSPYHVNNTVKWMLLGGALFTTSVQAYMNLKGLTMGIIMLNVISMIAFGGIATYLYKTGKVHMAPSYELV
ncbi:MAG: amino acid permease, partial [Oscillospiraceae bacterium]|nr:amino acid permease [Oscillospiraceae bacterium]